MISHPATCHISTPMQADNISTHTEVLFQRSFLLNFIKKSSQRFIIMFFNTSKLLFHLFPLLFMTLARYNIISPVKSTSKITLKMLKNKTETTSWVHYHIHWHDTPWQSLHQTSFITTIALQPQWQTPYNIQTGYSIFQTLS